MAERRLIVKTKREEKKQVKTPLENVNSFLYKIWSLVNDETISSIHWSQDGEKLVIENPSKFTAKVLACNERQLFKTRNISSFIRQLNLYGFRRVKENCGKIPLIFKNEFFKKGRPDLLVEMRRKRPLPMNKHLLSLSNAKVPKPNLIRQNQIHPSPGFTPYPSVPTSQPYPYFNNTPAGLAGKNVPVPFVTPFAVNHGPTFINLGSTIYSKPRMQASEVSKVEEDTESVQTPDSKELYNLKLASEGMYYSWQHSANYNTSALQDRKAPIYNNTVQSPQPFIQIQGNYHKYQYFNGNMCQAVPQQRGYRNYGDESISYQHLRNRVVPVPSNPYMPFSSFPAPPQFLKPASFVGYPKTEHSPKLAAKVKTENTFVACSETSTKTKLESFSIFTSHLQPKTEVKEKIITELTAYDRNECAADKKE